MPSAFSIKTPVFEGPLDLLLSLIEKRKLFINDISLSKVTDDFILHIKTSDNIPIADSAQFILIASTLLLIKSRSLLPSLNLTEEEEGGINDLQIRLKIYQKIKDASVNIKNLFGDKIMFAQSQSRIITPVFAPHKSMNTPSLVQAIKDVIRSLPQTQKESVPKAIIKKVISLEDMIDSLTKRVTQGLRMKFSEFSSPHKHDKINIIVSFLAMLELVKQGGIHVSQEENFGEIDMETKNVGVPRYDML